MRAKLTENERADKVAILAELIDQIDGLVMQFESEVKGTNAENWLDAYIGNYWGRESGYLGSGVRDLLKNAERVIRLGDDDETEGE